MNADARLALPRPTARLLADLPPALAAWAKQLGASVSIDADGWVRVQGPHFVRCYTSLDALEHDLFPAPIEPAPGRYVDPVTPEEKARRIMRRRDIAEELGI